MNLSGVDIARSHPPSERTKAPKSPPQLTPLALFKTAIMYSFALFFFVHLFINIGQGYDLAQRGLDRLVFKRDSFCTPIGGESNDIDDVPAIEAAIQACSSGVIYIPPGSTYHINSQVKFTGCAGCTFQIEGILNVASDTSYWAGKTTVFSLSGVTGASIYSSTGSGVINGNGQDAWDLFAVNSSISRVKSMLAVSGSTGILVSNITFKNPPNTFISVSSSSSNISFSQITLSVISNSTVLPKNTDGWDISGSYVTIRDSNITNTDDCMALNNGANFVTIMNVRCTGSHGISVGSLGRTYGRTDTVQNIYINGATMTNTSKAAGIKLWPAGPSHGTAVVNNVTWENVVVDGSDYGFQIQNCYGETSDYCSQYPSNAQLSGIVVKGWNGQTSSHYAPVVANIDCPPAGTCGVALSAFSVVPPIGPAKYLCANTPIPIGVNCTGNATG